MIGKELISGFIQKNRRILPGMAVIFILATLLIIRSGYGYHNSFQEEIEVKRELYLATAETLTGDDELEKLIRKAEGRLKSLEGGLLEANRPPIAAAKLQKAVKDIASRNGLSIISERAIPFVDGGNYLKIPVEFQLKSDTDKLTKFLHELAASPLIMGVSELKVRVDDSRRLDVTVTIEGMMSKVN